MAPTYEVNSLDDAAGLPGALIGRYPGDEYTGVIMSKGAQDLCVGYGCGNPWFLATHAMAEVMYSTAAAAGKLVPDEINHNFLVKAMELGVPASDRSDLKGLPTCGSDLAQMLVKGGDGMLARTKHHTGQGLHMSEQIYRGNAKLPPLPPGKMIGARDLTWSYASLLDALS